MNHQAKNLLFVAVMAIAAAGCATSSSVGGSPSASVSQAPGGGAGLKFSTWNVEHLAYPADQGCRPRTGADVDALRAYARSLDADVVALQEVASREAVELLFPASDWRTVMSARPDSEPYECRESGRPSTQQKVAFAVRKAIPVLDTRQYAGLGLDLVGLRYGLSVTLDTPGGVAEVLNVHLKSGCFVDDYERGDDEDCEVLAKQATWLDAWVEEKKRAGEPYLILGDFNHRITAPYNRMTRLLAANADGATSTAAILTRDLIGCHPWYPAPIDNIVAGGSLAGLAGETATVQPFVGQETRPLEGMLSDHCAVSAAFATEFGELSMAVRWQTESKERELMSLAVYEQATRALSQQAGGQENWVVVMDVDETVLDNSAYQVNLDLTGQSFASDTWAAWVAKERATVVPGALEFIKAVFAAGGRVALVTNRDASLDSHTWANLLGEGFPVSADNTCLLGRTQADKDSVDGARYINDKDLRREQIRQGSARCYGEVAASWREPQAIVMEIGDNIKDIGGVTQEGANPAELVERHGSEIFVLPNPMYGSWQ